MRNHFLQLVFIIAISNTGCVGDRLSSFLNEPTDPQKPSASGIDSKSKSAQFKKSNADKALQESGLLKLKKLGKSKFLIMDSVENVWKALIAVISKDYHLTTVNRDSGILVSDWDSFYRGVEIFRDRVSTRVYEKKAGQTELYLHVTQERLDRNITGPALWLPDVGEMTEIERLVNNLAAYLKIPKSRVDPNAWASKTSGQNF